MLLPRAYHALRASSRLSLELMLWSRIHGTRLMASLTAACMVCLLVALAGQLACQPEGREAAVLKERRHCSLNKVLLIHTLLLHWLAASRLQLRNPQPPQVRQGLSLQGGDLCGLAQVTYAACPCLGGKDAESMQQATFMHTSLMCSIAAAKVCQCASCAADSV